LIAELDSDLSGDVGQVGKIANCESSASGLLGENIEKLRPSSLLRRPTERVWRLVDPDRLPVSSFLVKNCGV